MTCTPDSRLGRTYAESSFYFLSKAYRPCQGTVVARCLASPAVLCAGREVSRYRDHLPQPGFGQIAALWGMPTSDPVAGRASGNEIPVRAVRTDQAGFPEYCSHRAGFARPVGAYSPIMAHFRSTLPSGQAAGQHMVSAAGIPLPCPRTMFVPEGDPPAPRAFCGSLLRILWMHKGIGRCLTDWQA